MKEILTKTVVLRMACQWSPRQWAEWSPQEIYAHRVRIFVRSLLGVYLNPDSLPFSSERLALLKRLSRHDINYILPRESNLTSVRQPVPSGLINHWRNLADIANSTNGAAGVIDVAELTRLTEKGVKIWDLLPGLTTLQQLMQPLVEALILCDRLWSLEARDDIAFASLVRLFNPKISPRCMALVAVKNNPLQS